MISWTKKTGLFITLEGIEGCGKSTQARMLAEKLSVAGRGVILTREPGGPPISEKIRSILLDPACGEMIPETELLLYMAARSQHTAQWIIPALCRGETVISDRYFDSTVAYQGAARHLDRNEIRRITAFATGGLIPDTTFLIDLPVEIGMARIRQKTPDRIELENSDFHQKVREGFLEAARLEPHRFVIIGGTQSVEDIHRSILTSLHIRYPEKIKKPLPGRERTETHE